MQFTVAALTLTLLLAQSAAAQAPQAPDPVSKIVRRLGGDDERQQRAALTALFDDRSLRDRPEVRQAVLGLLFRSITRDQTEAAKEQQTPAGVRAVTPWRAFYRAVVVTATWFERDPAAPPLLARVDGYDPGAVYAVVQPDPMAVGPIVALLREPTPRGYSSEFKARLVRTLTVLSNSPRQFRGAVERDVTAVTRERLATTDNAAELLALVELSDAVDDPAVLRQISFFAASSASLNARGITNPKIVSDIQTASRRILARRVTVP